MMRNLGWMATLAIAGMCLAGRASAQSTPPTPPPPPPIPGTTLTPAKATVHVSLGFANDQTGRQRYLYTFKFPASVEGTGFKPGEQVTISVKNVSAQPVTVTADDSGHFLANLSFTWKFCGPRGKQASPPVFQAVGNGGSSDQFTEPAPPCPQLAISGSAAEQTASPGTVLPFEGQGFGFAPHERVTVRKSAGNPYAETTPIHVVADAEGRIRFHATAPRPSPCSATSKVYEIESRGNGGTAVLSDLFWFQSQTGCAAGDAVKRTPPIVQPGTDSSQDNHDRLAVSLRRSSVHPGGEELITLQADLPGAATLTVRYPGQHASRRKVTLANAIRATVRVRVPSSITIGTARINVAYQPQFVIGGGTSPSLSTTFTIN